MIVLGLVLLIAGLLVPSLSILFTIGLVVLIVGLALLVLGHPVDGRRYWF